ncbi:AAA family ATPase [Actinomadura barringtoniae]|uniref:AAA family ATPase n=1 Tax=Actinomadura barringtoniae TaxID=1427535 RepID=A0A939PIQ1_9ACTN|nr:AAA family ATPase [Actinomadura barringtoniae]MBO2449281.1 AAA family ATPase [Actinomadura barringtoniae]
MSTTQKPNPTDKPVRPHRYVLTGAPGVGKTTIAHRLRARGLTVVDEAATDVIADRQARGEQEPWNGPGFLEEVLQTQQERQQNAPDTVIQIYDRSPLCTLALAHYLQRTVPTALKAAIDRIERENVYQRQVFLIHPIGFVTPTAARRITLEESLTFARIHEQVYRSHGYELIDVPPAPIEQRASAIETHIRQ